MTFLFKCLLFVKYKSVIFQMSIFREQLTLLYSRGEKSLLFKMGYIKILKFNFIWFIDVLLKYFLIYKMFHRSWEYVDSWVFICNTMHFLWYLILLKTLGIIRENCFTILHFDSLQGAYIASWEKITTLVS